MDQFAPPVVASTDRLPCVAVAGAVPVTKTCVHTFAVRLIAPEAVVEMYPPIDVFQSMPMYTFWVILDRTHLLIANGEPATSPVTEPYVHPPLIAVVAVDHVTLVNVGVVEPPVVTRDSAATPPVPATAV
jgi:hypothetical protein